MNRGIKGEDKGVDEGCEVMNECGSGNDTNVDTNMARTMRAVKGRLEEGTYSRNIRGEKPNGVRYTWCNRLNRGENTMKPRERRTLQL